MDDGEPAIEGKDGTEIGRRSDSRPLLLLLLVVILAEEDDTLPSFVRLLSLELD